MMREDPELHERHLVDSEIELVVWRKRYGRTPESADADFEILDRHLGTCEKCRLAVDERSDEIDTMRQKLAEGPSERRSDCPPEYIWPQVAAGAVFSDEIADHGAECLYCGPLLRRAVVAIQAEPSAEEFAAIRGLKGLAPGVAPALVSKLDEVVENRGRAKTHSWPVRNWRLAIAASVAIVGAVSYWGYQRQMDDPEVLLARVYSAHRTVEWRFNGAAQSPLRLTRGDHASDTNRSPQLLRLEARIAEQVARRPDDPYWIIADGRLNLLLWRYDAALRDFQRARELLPESVGVLSDLAGAYFERAEATGHDSDYGTAIELLSKTLETRPGDPVALFNRGLAEDRMYLFGQAVSDWEELLKKEPSGPWAEEVRTRLAEVKKKLKEH